MTPAGGAGPLRGQQPPDPLAVPAVMVCWRPSVVVLPCARVMSWPASFCLSDGLWEDGSHQGQAYHGGKGESAGPNAREPSSSIRSGLPQHSSDRLMERVH